MRIAFVTGQYVTESIFYGGLGNYLHRVSLALRDLGHHPIIVLASDRDERIDHDGIEVYRVDCTLPSPLNMLRMLTLTLLSSTIARLWQSYVLNRKVTALDREDPITVVQFTHLSGLGLFRPKHIPSVVRLSSWTPLWRELGGYDAQYAFVVRQQEIMEARALMRADRIFGPSTLIASVVEEELRRPVEVIETPFVLDTCSHDNSVYNRWLDGRRFLLFFGTLNRLKGLVTIADQLHELLARNPELYFAFVGPDYGGYKGSNMMDYVWKKAGEHRARVIYFGKLRHSQLYPLIQNASAVVLPSRIDNFPNACIEAMAFGKVVIGTSGTSLEQLLEDGKSGFLCARDDPQSLLAAIEKSLNLGDREREHMGHRAVGRVEQLKPNIVVKELIEFYSDVVNGRSARGGVLR